MFGIIVMFSLPLSFLIHIIFVRICGLFKQPSFRQHGVIASHILGFLPLCLIFYFRIVRFQIYDPSEILWSGIYLFLIYSLFGYVYFHLFNMSETARRVRILAEINKTGIFKKEDLIERYLPSDMISNRLERLVALGELKLLGDRYLIGRGIFILPAKIVFSLRNILFSAVKDTKNMGSVNIK